MPKVSIIVPVYNGMPYLKQCLNTIAKQTLNDFEVIVVNDGSTDESGIYASKMAKKYPFIRIYNQENHGLYAARKKGLSLAKGDYVGWVDADDFVDISMFKKLYYAAITNDSELTYCDYSFYPAKTKTKEKWFRPYTGNRNVDFVERNNQPWNKLVKRDLLEHLGIGDMFESCFDEAYIKVLLHAKNPVSLKEELYFYRVENGSMSSSYKNVKHYESFITASEALKKEMNGEPLYWIQYFDYRIIYYTLITMLVAANAKDIKEYRKLQEKLETLPYFKNNPHIDHILNTNFGKAKAFAIKNLVPNNYIIATILATLAFEGK